MPGVRSKRGPVQDGPHATIRYEADLRNNDNAWLRLPYRTNGEAVDYKVQLVTNLDRTMLVRHPAPT